MPLSSEYGLAGQVGMIRPAIGFEVPGLSEVQRELVSGVARNVSRKDAYPFRLARHKTPFVPVVEWPELRHSPLLDGIDSRDRDAVTAVLRATVARAYAADAVAQDARVDVTGYAINPWTRKSRMLEFDVEPAQVTGPFLDAQEDRLLGLLGLETPEGVNEVRTCMLALFHRGPASSYVTDVVGDLNQAVGTDQQSALAVGNLVVDWQVLRTSSPVASPEG